MTNQQQLAFIKEKCIEANPSILDLKFGCHFFGRTTIGDPFDTPLLFENWKEKNKTIRCLGPLGNQCIWNRDDIKIIGRKIGIADIFHLLGTLGELSKENMHSVVFYYNLLDDDITHQSPEFIAFAARLLGNEAGK